MGFVNVKAKLVRAMLYKKIYLSRYITKFSSKKHIAKKIEKYHFNLRSSVQKTMISKIVSC